MSAAATKVAAAATACPRHSNICQTSQHVCRILVTDVIRSFKNPSSVDTNDSTIRQQYPATFRGLKQTRSSFEPAIYLDSGLSFDDSSEALCMGRGAWLSWLEGEGGGPG